MNEEMQDAASFDEVALELFAGLLTEEEIRNRGKRKPRIDAHAIQLAAKRVDTAGVVEKIADWRREDRHGKRAGGRPALLDDRQVLIMSLVLICEGTPILVSEMAPAFQHRLTANARRALGVEALPQDKQHGWDYEIWYQRVWRALHRLIETIDAWPAPRRLLTREQRAAVFADRNSLRNQNRLRRKAERNRWFTNAFLEMTLKAQPDEIANAWGGSISIDQTALPAPSQQKPWMKHQTTREEMPKWYEDDGSEVPRYVSEIDATLYPKDKSAQKKEHTADEDGKTSVSSKAFELSYAANIAVQVSDDADNPVPQLIVAASLGRFGRDISEHTLSAVDSMNERGRPVKQLTSDMGYSAGIKVEDFHAPLAERGVGLVIDYKSHQKGTKGNVGGAIQVEGALFCPAMPEDLASATVDADSGRIDAETYQARIDERLRYKLHRKERADANGTETWTCPALGPSATVVCPKLRPKEAADDEKQRKQRRQRLKAGGRKTAERVKVEILDRNVPAAPDRVCCNKSIAVKRDDLVATKQDLDYGTRQWKRTYNRNRNTIESVNASLKAGPERVGSSAARRMRGLAAQSYIFTMMLVAWNLRRLASFMAEQLDESLREEGTAAKTTGAHRPEPMQRRRDRDGMSNYNRWAKHNRRPMTENQLEPPPPKV